MPIPIPSEVRAAVVKNQKVSSKSKRQTTNADHVDDFLLMAKLAAAKNYNAHQPQRGHDPVTPDDLGVVWVSKGLRHWRGRVSPTVRGGM